MSGASNGGSGVDTAKVVGKTDDGSQDGSRTHALFLASALQSCMCPAGAAVAGAAVAARVFVREAIGRATALDWAGEVDRQLQGLHHDLSGWDGG